MTRLSAVPVSVLFIYSLFFVACEERGNVRLISFPSTREEKPMKGNTRNLLNMVRQKMLKSGCKILSYSPDVWEDQAWFRQHSGLSIAGEVDGILQSKHSVDTEVLESSCYTFVMKMSDLPSRAWFGIHPECVFSDIFVCCQKPSDAVQSGRYSVWDRGDGEGAGREREWERARERARERGCKMVLGGNVHSRTSVLFSGSFWCLFCFILFSWLGSTFGISLSCLSPLTFSPSPTDWVPGR